MKPISLISIMVLSVSVLFTGVPGKDKNKEFNRLVTGGGCDYIIGDVNAAGNYNGLDVIYGVTFLKGGSDPMCRDCPLCPDWNYCGDVNGSCSYNGLDISYGVAYLKGGSAPIPCADCPPNP
ncbi:MAG: hypothetical protein JSU85_15655 [Candidatus Zixiibacteriota bacterium]|nr:MAG: hypothetical protein JSU85_15655 [candidate division Zixibacteria bacterium]